MRWFKATLWLLITIVLPGNAWGISTAPLQAISAYIDGNNNCDGNLVAWNREYIGSTLSGKTPPTLYYQTLTIRDWGACGRPYLNRIFSELQKAWRIYGRGNATAAELEAKEAELVKLLFDILKAGENGKSLLDQYEQDTSWKLLNLVPDRQFFNCTYFGDKPRCEE